MACFRGPVSRTSRVLWWATGWVLIATATGCGGSSPAAPGPITTPVVSAPIVLMSHLTATPTAPLDNGSVDYRSTPVTLQATVPAPPDGALIVDTFEFDDNPDFSSPARRDVPRQSTLTSTTFVIVPSQLERDLYWRVRSASGELLGDVSKTSRFKVLAETLQPPVQLYPENGSTQSAGVRFTLQKLVHSPSAQVRTWSYDFEIARDEGFRSMVHAGRVTEAATVNYRPAADLATGRYYWRARAFDDAGHYSDYSPAWMFDVSDPFALAPSLSSPAPRATVPQPLVFVLSNGPVFGDSQEAPQYHVQISAVSSFDTVLASGWSWAGREGATSVTVATNLPGGTYYWRARSVKLKTVTHAEIASGWTDPRPVVIAGLALAAPTGLSPADYATTSLRPQLSVTNAVRTGQGGPLVYRFEVSTDAQFAASPAVVADVPEGVGTTSWTVPFDMPVGVVLWWRVRATEPVTGTTSSFSSIGRFAAVDSRTRLYTLTLSLPASCGYKHTDVPLFVQSTDALGTTPMRIVSKDASSTTLDSLVLALDILPNGTVSGTLGGTATSHAALSYAISAAAGSTTPAAVSGVRTPVGFSGTFSGRVTETLAPISSTPCAVQNVAWSVVPRV